MNLSQILKVEREKIKMSQERLGEIVGATQVYISQLERGVKKPSLDMAIKLSNALGISLDKLAGNQNLV